MTMSSMAASSTGGGPHARAGDAADEDVDDAVERRAHLGERVVELHLQEPVDAGQEDGDEVERGHVAARLAALLRGGELARERLDERARLAPHLARVASDHGEELVPERALGTDR